MFAKEDWSAKNGAETRKGAFLCRKKSVICKSGLCVDESEATKKKAKLTQKYGNFGNMADKFPAKWFAIHQHRPR